MYEVSTRDSRQGQHPRSGSLPGSGRGRGNFLSFGRGPDLPKSARLVVRSSPGMVEVAGVQEYGAGPHGEGPFACRGQEVRTQSPTDVLAEESEIVDLDPSLSLSLKFHVSGRHARHGQHPCFDEVA